MRVEIKIMINHKSDFAEFDKNELISDIKYQFVDITGYEIDSIEVNEV